MTPHRILGALLLMAASAIVTTMPSSADDDGPPCDIEFLGEIYEGREDADGECIPIDDLDCEDFLPAKNIDVSEGDPFGLDGNGDGLACKDVPTTTTTTTEITPPAVPDALPAQPVLAEPSFTG